MNGTTSASLLLALLLAATGHPTPPQPEPRTRCAYCGMYVTAAPSWVAALTLGDGKVLYYDGPKDMFKHLYFGDFKKGSGTLAGWVTVEGKGFTPLRDAVFVEGSDRLGPMGDDLAPLADEAAAGEFIKVHGGRALKCDQITPEVVKALD